MNYHFLFRVTASTAIEKVLFPSISLNSLAPLSYLKYPDIKSSVRVNGEGDTSCILEILLVLVSYKYKARKS